MKTLTGRKGDYVLNGYIQTVVLYHVGNSPLVKGVRGLSYLVFILPDYYYKAKPLILLHILRFLYRYNPLAPPLLRGN